MDGDLDEILKLAGFGYCGVDTEGKIVAWLGLCPELTGILVNEALGKRASSFGLSIPQRETSSIFNRIFPKGVSCEIKGARVNGIERYILSVEGFAEGLKRRLMARETLFGMVLELVPHLVFARDAKGTFILANKALADLYGRPISEIIGGNLRDFHTVDHELERQLADDLHVIESGESLIIPEDRFTSPSKRGYVFETNRIPFKLPETGEIAVLGISIDITERIKAERALSEEKERLAITLRSIGEGVIATDTIGIITMMNPMAGKILGWDELDAIGVHIGQVFRLRQGRNAQIMNNPVFDIIHQRKMVQGGPDTCVVRKDGEIRYISERGAPIYDSNNSIIGAVIVFSDVSERRLMESELQRIQKIESMGLVAGGMAHDFNNILAGLLGKINVAQLGIEQGNEAWDSLEDARKAISQAKALTAQLSQIAKGAAEPIRNPVDIALLTREVVELSLRGSGIRMSIELPIESCLSAVDSTQYTQVIQNLVINAKQAMGGTGNLKVRISKKDIKPDNLLSLQAGSYVMTVIEDTGPGIPPELLPKIFDPYFTTKSRGSGLGLTIAYSAIKKHGGAIQVESRQGEGAAFTIYIPLYQEMSSSNLR